MSLTSDVKKVAYVSGTRADYGLMSRVLLGIQHHSALELMLFVTGMHLSPRFGLTHQNITNDGLTVTATLGTEPSLNNPSAMVLSLSELMAELAREFTQQRPDILLLLGDRGEMLAAAMTAIHLNIPIVHIHGGERSGTIDESLRHAISKLSHYHLVATQASADRLIRMGEVGDRVVNVGSPGLDDIMERRRSNKFDLFSSLSLDPDLKTAILLFHPVIQDHESIKDQIASVVNAIPIDLQVVCIMPNSDTGSNMIIEKLNEFTNNNHRAHVFNHLQRTDFLALLEHSNVLIGNSSTGIIEAASLNTWVINIGDRQNLRERNANVIDVDINESAINEAISDAINRSPYNGQNLYGDGKSSERIINFLIDVTPTIEVLKKVNEY